MRLLAQQVLVACTGAELSWNASNAPEAQRLPCNNYLGNGEHLLVHFDEKWFWWLVLRKSAKVCDEIGLDPHVFRAYHKLHIEKVMGVAVTGHENNMENGGVGLKLGFYWAEAARVAKKQQRQVTKEEDGKVRFDGEIVREKGDIYFKDCAVTGSDPGTSSDPKFPLKNLFAKHVFPLLERLVGPGGRFQGYTIIIQGDQAGPHEEEDFVKYCRAYCAKKGGCFGLQAPQAPRLNNLDLAVFPAMSRRHSIMSRKKGLRVLKKQEIWDAAMQVWDELPFMQDSARVRASVSTGTESREGEWRQWVPSQQRKGRVALRDR